MNPREPGNAKAEKNKEMFNYVPSRELGFLESIAKFLTKTQ